MRRLGPLAALPLALVLAGCPLDLTGDDPEGCTREFGAVTLNVRDDAGRSVSVEGVSVRRASGQELVCPSGRDDVSGCVQPFVLSGPDRSRITVVHDGVEVSRAGETLLVGASAGTLGGTASLVVRNDGCHVEKVSGPSEIVLR